MKLNCHPHQWFQDNPLLPSRRVFEQKDGGPTESSGTEEEDAPETSRDGGPFTSRSNEYETKDEEPEAETLKSEDVLRAMDTSKTETAKVIRGTIIETLEEKVANLERELAEKNERLEGKNKEIGQLEEQNTDLTVENVRLRELALEEPLTGLGTKEYFYERMFGMLDESARYGKDFSLLFIDLDKFKDINDKLGHVAGDEALRFVGEIIHETMRTSDEGFRLETEKQGKGFRYGGEELVIVLPETNKEKARIAAERLRETIENELKTHLTKAFPDKKEIIEKEIMGTASIGITSYNDAGRRDEKDYEKLVKMIVDEADKAMYAAKAGGRNQVRAHGEKAAKEKAKIDEDLIDAAAEKGPIDEYVAAMKKSAEDTIPEPGMREKALREAADQIGKGNAA